MLRLHFNLLDLARVRVADRPYAQFEAVAALRRLQGTEAGVLFDGWRRQVRARGGAAGPVLPRLFELVPRSGRIVSFLTPLAASHDPERWLQDVRATPHRQVQDGLERYARLRGRPLRGWLQELADGGPVGLRELESTLRSFTRAAVEPVWTAAVASVDAERARRARELLDGGLDRLLAGLPGVVRWEPPVLTLSCTENSEIRLLGRGLVLIPSYFCWSSILLVERPASDALMLIYPVQQRLLAPARGGARRPLAGVLGRTRAAVLELIAEASVAGSSTGSSTSELARRLGVAAGTVSWHVAALREAGLVGTQRNRRAIHSLRPAGRYLLDQSGEPGFQPTSNLWTVAP